MANEINIVRKGTSFDFVFDRGGLSLDGWILTINVRQFPSDSAFVSRVIAADGTTWPGFLTPAETTALTSGTTYRLTGVQNNASTGEEQQVVDTIRFNVSDAWG